MSPLLINLSFLIPKPTGIATYARNLVGCLQSLQPTLLSPDTFPDFSCYSIPGNLTPDFGRKGHFNRLLWTEFSLPKIYRQLSANLLFSPIPEAPIFAPCRHVVTVHDLIPLRFPQRFSPLVPYHKYYIPQVLRRAEHILCDSESTARDATDFLQIPAKKTTPILLAYDADRFRFLDLPTGNYFFYIGRHDPYKNLQRAVEAFARVAKKRDVEFWIAGPPDRRYTPLLQEKAWQLGVGDRVKILGYLPYEDLPRTLNQAIALVFPSLWEGFGLPVLEAMACGTPAVTSKIASIPEVGGRRGALRRSLPSRGDRRRPASALRRRTTARSPPPRRSRSRPPVLLGEDRPRNGCRSATLPMKTNGTDASNPLSIRDPEALRQNILQQLRDEIVPRGRVRFPCLPSLLDRYVDYLQHMFAALDRPCSDAQIEQMRRVLAENLEKGFRASPQTTLVVAYEFAAPTDGSLHRGLACKVSLDPASLAERYQEWLETRQPPFFGVHPSAKAIAVAKTLPPGARVLDIGAGTGRNALPLARLGFAADAIELAPGFADRLRQAAAAENLPVATIVGDILDGNFILPPAFYNLAIAVELTCHLRSPQQLRLLLAKTCDALLPGGLLLFDIFLGMPGWEPSAIVRERSQAAWSSVFTYEELAAATVDLPLKILEDEPVLDYEGERSPPEAFPPTSWFAHWAAGRDIFPHLDGQPPVESRWILCRRL